MTRIKTLIQMPLMRSLFWVVMLIFLLIFWPRESVTSVESESISKPEIIYIYVYTNEQPPAQDIKKEVGIKEVKEVIKKPKYGFTKDEIYLMTVLLSGSGKTDGDGEYDVDFRKDTDTTYDQVSLVLSVVMNRVMSSKFPDTVSEVIRAPGQFSPMPKWKNKLPVVSDKSYQIVKNWCEDYDACNVSDIPENHLYFSGNGTINKSR